MTPTLRDKLNQIDANALPEVLRLLDFGSILRDQVPQTIRQATPDGGNPEQVGTLEALGLPDEVRCCVITRAQCRSGAGAGELVVDAYGTTPGTTHIAPAPNGDIVLLTADANEGVDVTFIPERGEVVTLSGTCGTDSVFHIPSQYVARGVLLLISADATEAAAGKTGRKIVLVPGSAPATLKANLDLAKSLVQFNDATDAVTKCTVKLFVAEAKPTSQLDAANTVHI